VQRLINTVQNNNILLFVRPLSLTSFIKALQLSKVGLPSSMNTVKI